MDAFKQTTPLDSGQADALIASLSTSFTLTQGPPGTGKSYMGTALVRVLLDNKAKGKLGPLLLVSYSNHALDGILENLLDAGVEQIVRIGSRSQSEKLTELNLREVAKETPMTKTERNERRGLTAGIKEDGLNITGILQEFSGLGLQHSIAAYLKENNPEQHDELFALKDEEGWEEVDRHTESRLCRWLEGALFPQVPNSGCRTVEELNACNLQETSLPERHSLHGHWISEIKYELRQRLAKSLRNYSEMKGKRDIIRTEIDRRTLLRVDIIGVTTSRLARNRALLQKLGSKVLIAGEAAEVQEPHLLTAMLPTIEHVILIGDHLQLRPQVRNYALSSESKVGKKYCLDVSLFERLIHPLLSTLTPLQFSILLRQRRMFPSISSLIRGTMYPLLEDAPNVSEYPDISGMRHRLFWLNHKNREDPQDPNLLSTSKTNEWEANMTTAVVHHLVRQGLYKPSEIAVLTPNLGQLCKLRDKLETSFEITLSKGDALALGEESDADESLDGDPDIASHDSGRHDKSFALQPGTTEGTLAEAVRLSTIDNFQGEEATVVVISLVRCNEDHKPGFLRTENRCNVLLSRAKHGMYIIGDAETAGVVPMWAKVIDMLKAGNNLGEKLELCCPRHPEKVMEISEPEEFAQLAPAGRCEEPCSRPLKCTHDCKESHCHADVLHDSVYCLEPCNRPIKCQNGHVCPRICGDNCPEPSSCPVIIPDQNIALECGHILTDPACWQMQDLEAFACQELVLKNVPGCKHTVLVTCSTDVSDPNFQCSAICNSSLLYCQHRSENVCSSCRTKQDGIVIAVDHGACTALCGKRYDNCIHACSRGCHADEDCSPCEAVSDRRCTHTKSHRGCSQYHVPCLELCTSCPSDSDCHMPCAMGACDAVPATRRCTKLLSCGCRCPSLDSELCPDAPRYCQKCRPSESLNQEADQIECKNYRDVDVDSHPVIVLDCGHIFTTRNLDLLMDMAKYYTLNSTGSPMTLKTTSPDPFPKGQLTSCPKCHGNLSNIARYRRLVHPALLVEDIQKFVCWSNGKLIPLTRRIMVEQNNLFGSADNAKLRTRSLVLIGSSDAQIAAIRGKGGLERYSSIFGARRLILGYLAEVRSAEQPFEQLRDMVKAIRGNNAEGGVTIFPFDGDAYLLRTRATLLGTAIHLRCDLVILSDILAVRYKMTTIAHDSSEIEVDFSQNRLDCEKLIHEALKSKHKLQQAEGHVFWARFAALEINASTSDGGIAIDDERTTMARLKDDAIGHLDAAESLCREGASETQSIVHEIAPTKRMLRGTVFYTPVTSSEMRAVASAMPTDFQTAGDWYCCVNEHPFTIGERNMSAEALKCPQCNGTVRGLEHEAA